MKHQYSLGMSPSRPHNRSVILHGKPSEIPRGIWHDLTHVCGSYVQFLDGPNNKVYFEVVKGPSGDKVLIAMQEYLNRCGWEKIEFPS